MTLIPKGDNLLEGSYLYYQNEVNYAQENFKLIQLRDSPQIIVVSEIVSRIETGEFLKVIVNFEMTNHYVPVFVRIEKSIGNKYVQETFRVDQATQELTYSFQDVAKKKHEFKKSHSSKHYLTSPSFASSVMFTLSRKLDPTGRTAIQTVNTANNWTYEAPPSDKIIYAELKNRELDDYKLNNTTLAASHLCLYEYDSISPLSEIPANIYISKWHGIPYQLVQGTQKITIKNLKQI